MQVGGNPEDLAALKVAFETQAGTVQELTSTFRGHLDNTSWQGASAERFRTAWMEDYERVLKRLEQALLDAGTEVGHARDRLIQATS